MSTVESASKVLQEIDGLFASAPSDEEILQFRPSAEVSARAAQLIKLNRNETASPELQHELDQFEQAELLMRMVKAKIRSRRRNDRE